MIRIIPLLAIIAAGIAGIIIFGYYALVDWDALEKSYANFSTVAQSSPEFANVFVAEAEQNIHRINLFAEGVWALQSAILAAIGFHGLCVLPRRIGN
ncbi:MAG: hypothetical protein ACFB0G_20740 [Leptolyngbyaceae cyanobacterium]